VLVTFGNQINSDGSVLIISFPYILHSIQFILSTSAHNRWPKNEIREYTHIMDADYILSAKKKG